MDQGERGFRARTDSLDDDPVGLGDNVLDLERLLHVVGVAGGERFPREIVEVDDGLGDDVSAAKKGRIKVSGRRGGSKRRGKKDASRDSRSGNDSIGSSDERREHVVGEAGHDDAANREEADKRRAVEGDGGRERAHKGVGCAFLYASVWTCREIRWPFPIPAQVSLTPTMF